MHNSAIEKGLYLHDLHALKRVQGIKLILVSTDTEWTDLEISLAEPGFTTDFNVEQVRIFGGGIELLQRWLLYDAPRQGKGGVLEVDTDHYRWKVAFKKGQFKDVVVREFEIPTRRCLFVELRFTCTAAPDSADATISVIRESNPEICPISRSRQPAAFMGKRSHTAISIINLNMKTDTDVLV